MNILAISAHHPPCHFGGYELRVRDIMDGLAKRGHHIRVLTNLPGKQLPAPASPSPYPVIRRLHNRRRARIFPKEILYDLIDTALLEREIKHFKPDVIYLGHTYILSKALMPYLARQTLPIVYDEGGAGLVEAWTEHGRWFRFTGDYSTGSRLLDALKDPVMRLVCTLSRGRIKPQWQWPHNMGIIFNSELNRSVAAKAGVPLDRAAVIHSGVDTRVFTFKERTGLGSPVTIIVPGRIERRKGQLDAVRLVEGLLAEGIETRLILAGSGWTDGYYQEVLDEIRRAKLESHITIFPMLSPAELAEQYRASDICFFPSYFRTGFSRVPLEAMASGCLVITYGNEGSDEIVQDQASGYIMQQADIPGAVGIITGLSHNPQRHVEVVLQALETIRSNHSQQIYVEKIEKQIAFADPNSPSR